MSKKQKESLSLVVVGHVDHGKSTVIGRLLHDTHSLPQGTIDKVKKIAKETGKPFEYAYLLDAFEEEQQQGITIDTTQIQFQTQNRDYVIIDAPGHVEFLKNMISGAANAEAAFLIVDVKRGIEEQTKRHAYMLKLLGIKKVYAIFNKMDLIDYDQARFETVKADLTDFLDSLGLLPLDHIPISAFYGENILEQTGAMPWYQGKTLLNVLDNIEKEVGLAAKPLRFPIQDVYKFDDRRIIAGRIESGTLKVGDKITIWPEGRQTSVVSFAYWQKQDEIIQALPKQSIGVTVSDEFFNHRGEIITLADEQPLVSNALLANVFWMGKTPLVKNKRYKLKLATQEVFAEVAKVEKVLDAATLEQFENAEQVKLNDVAEVVFKLEQTIAFDAFADFDVTGRFVIIDGYDVSGGGTIAESREIVAEELTGTNVTDGKKVFNLRAFDEKLISQGGNIRTETAQGLYHVGETAPLISQTYHYPSDLDILLLSERLIIVIRNGVFADFIKLEHYVPSSVALINSDGFEIALTSQAEFEQFVTDFQYLDGKNKAKCFNRWLKFDTYHHLLFSEDYDMI
jgi:sulfate adenylyltransferase large subunit